MEEAAPCPSLGKLQDGRALFLQIRGKALALDLVGDSLQAARVEAQAMDQPIAGDAGPLFRPNAAAAAAVILLLSRGGGAAPAAHLLLQAPFGSAHEQDHTPGCCAAVCKRRSMSR